MDPIVECVPNISEGRNPSVIKEVTDAIEAVDGVRLLDVDPGEKTNRTVITFIGAPGPVMEAAFQTVKKAAKLIDMAKHRGEHPRMGATDVVPFVPVSGLTMDDCTEMARKVGRRIGDELGIPVYLYEHAASRHERQNLSRVRAGEYEGLQEKLQDPEWAPDYGPVAFNARSGATAVGAREFLIAYNINLNSTDRRYANEIAYVLRERGPSKSWHPIMRRPMAGASGNGTRTWRSTPTTLRATCSPTGSSKRSKQSGGSSTSTIGLRSALTSPTTR